MAVAFDVSGAYRPESAEAIQLQIRGLDSTSVTVALKGALHEGIIRSNLTLDDETIIPGLTPLEGPIAATLTLSGPLNAAQLKLNVSNKETSLLALEAKASYGDPLRITGGAKVLVPEALLPSATLGRLGRAFDVNLDVALTEGSRLTVQNTQVAFERGVLLLNGTYAFDDGAIDLSPQLTCNDFHRLAGLESEGDAVPMRAEVPVSGTLDSLVMKPAVTVGGEPFLNGDLTVGLDDVITVAGTVKLHPAVPATPSAFRTVLVNGAHADLDVAYAQGLLTIEATRADIGGTSITLSGTANPAAKILNLQAQADADDLSAFADLAGVPLEGAVRLELTAHGDASQTLMEGTVQVERVVAGSVRLPEGNFKLNVTAGGFPSEVSSRIEAEIAGSFPQFAPQPHLTRDLTLEGKVAIEQLERVHISNLNVADGNLFLNANGTVDLETRTADFDTAIQIGQAADYAAVFGLPYRGGADMTLKIKSGDAPGSLVASLSGSMHDLGGLPAPVGDLLGNGATIQADAAFDGARATMNMFNFSSGGLNATGTGHFMAAERSLEVQLSGALASLEPLEDLAGHPLSGSAAFSFEARGPLDQLNAEGSLQATDLNLDVLVADSAAMHVSATGIPTAIAAEINASLTQDGATLDLQARGSKRDAIIIVEALELSAGDNRFSGGGSVDMGARRGHGTLSVEAPKLAELKTWLKMPLEGSLSLNAAIANGTSTLSGDLLAENVVVGETRLGRAEGTFAVDDVFKAPSGKISLSGGALEAGKLQVTALQINAEGPRAALAVRLMTDGTFQDSTRFTVDSGGTLAGETGTFNLQSLVLGLEAVNFALRSPATLSWHDGVATVSSLALDSASGNIQVSGSYAHDTVDLRATWDQLALHLAELAGMDPVAGTLSGTLAVTGSPDAPVASLDARVAGYRALIEDTDTPGMDLNFDARLNEGDLTAHLAAAVPDAAALQGQISLPVNFALAPWTFQIPAGAALNGVLNGTADLEKVAPLLPLEGHALRGALATDLTIRGTPTAPLLDGAITVDHGYYENGSTSTILNDLELTVTADGDTLRLTRFTANDTAGGALTGEGQIVFHPAEKTPYDFTLRLDQPRLVYRDDMRAQGAGELRLTGNSEGAALKGDLTVGPAYLTIPESSGKTRVTTVEFTEAEGESEGEEPEKATAYALGLDLRIGLPGKIFLSGPGLDSEWEGNFNVTRSAAEPAVEGVLRVKKGTLEFLGRLFSLADSTITFDGQSPPAPFLRIDAVTETEDVVAHVRMEGVTDALNITLESDPPLPQDEILSRVLFGQRLSDVSPVQALTLARYAPLFKKKQSGRNLLGSEGPKPFLVDRVSLRSGTGVGDASITTGKYLNDDFYLEFEQGLGAAESLLSLEWLFAPRWSLKGKTTSQGQGGLGVFWKKEY
jgi:translocation and assembly module TamB